MLHLPVGILVVELAATRLAGQPGVGDLLVVGPSLGTSVEALWGQCAKLLGDYEVIGWDLPGHGRSRPASAPFTIADLASAVREIPQGRDAWYAGISVGGAVGLQLAMESEPFRAVAALATAPKIGEAQAWYERAELVRRAGTGVMVSGSAERWFAPGFTDRQPEIAGALLTSLLDADPGSYALVCDALAEFDLRDHDAKLPLLMAVGEHDPVVPAAGVELAGCGHLPAAEDPQAVAMLLREFFRGVK
jgi:pimeloyl-ACP methyl ester carboxylesterase